MILKWGRIHTAGITGVGIGCLKKIGLLFGELEIEPLRNSISIKSLLKVNN
jgi:hypothetical protein